MIDVVMPYVNGNDKHWLKDYNEYIKTNTGFSDFNESRFRDWDTLRFSLRSIYENLPFIDRVVISLYDEKQIPEWLNINCDKLKILYHKDFLPKEIYPTFNSLGISPYLWSCDEISENFIAFNDDYFVGKLLKETDFFDNNKCVRTSFSLKTTNKFNRSDFPRDMWENIMVETKKIREKYFNKKEYYVDTHVALPMKKSAMKKVLEILGNKVIEEYSKHNSKIRTSTNFLSHYIAAWTILDNNDYIIKDNLIRRMCDIQDNTNFDKINEACQNAHLFCINDQFYLKDNNVYIETKNKLVSILQNKFPNKSPFEI